MIRFQMNLHPYGSGRGVGIIDASIWTTDCGNYHAYSINDFNMGSLGHGRIPKTQSGHRNPLHLLRDIINDLEIDSFNQDYVTTDADHPNPCAEILL